MDLYNSVASEISRRVTLRYSTSFGSSSKLLASAIKDDIYHIYGLVRIADEIVDTYQGADAGERLNDLELDVQRAITTGFSTNLIVQAFGHTVQKYTIDQTLIQAFFASMRLDLSHHVYDQQLYKTYIYGSAEAVGLMCLTVFCLGDSSQYTRLKDSASHLGAAYQKVNFLRDMASDWTELKRWYFPDSNFEQFNESTKQAIITDIRHDFKIAQPGIAELPARARYAVDLSASYYQTLTNRLANVPVEELKSRRLRVSTFRKLWLLGRVRAKQLLHV